MHQTQMVAIKSEMRLSPIRWTAFELAGFDDSGNRSSRDWF